MAVDMLFQSYIFVFLFLPVSLTGFYFIGNRWGGMAAKLWLIVMSLWFYGSFRIEYVFLLLLSAAFNYGMAGKLMKRAAKRILAAGIAGNLALLFFFKYMNFFIGNWNAMGGRELSLLRIALPVGISFFTFHQISYLVDCFRGEVDGGHLVDYILSVVYFPKLVEGPLVMPSEFLPRLASVGGKKPDGERLDRKSVV